MARSIPNLRRKTARLDHLAYRRKVACLDYSGRSQASVFPLGEYNELCEEGADIDRIQNERRAALWTPAQEGEYWALKGELGL